MQKGFVESFNGRLWANTSTSTCLPFCAMPTVIAARRDDYYYYRPHTSLAGFTPQTFLNRSAKDQSLNRTNL